MRAEPPLLGRTTAAEADVEALATLSAIEHQASTNLYESLSTQLESITDEAAPENNSVKVCTTFDETAIIDEDITGAPVLDEQGKVIANIMDAGRDVVDEEAKQSPQNTIKMAYRDRLIKILERPEVKTALD